MMSSDDDRRSWFHELTIPKIFFLLELAAAALLSIFIGTWIWKSMNISRADASLQGAILSVILLLFSIFAYKEAKKRW